MSLRVQINNSAKLAGIVSCILLTGACSQDAIPEPELRPVRSVVVAGGPGEHASTYTGEIRSRYETDLSFQVGGKLISRAVDVGSRVSKGMVLAQLDQTDQRLAVDSSTAAVNAARAELDRARSDEARYRDLLERGLTTSASYLTQQTAVKTAQSRLDQSTADLKLNQQRLAYTTLRADNDGIVTRVFAESGSVTAAGQRIISVARDGEIEAVFDVPDSRIDAVRSATAVSVSWVNAPAAVYPARLREISPTADPATRTYQVKAPLTDPPPTLHLGMTVAVTLSHATTQTGIELPATALFQKDGSPAVWVIRADRTLELRSVTVTQFDSDQVVIEDGVQLGERVVTAGVHRLAAGDQVRLLEDARP